MANYSPNNIPNKHADWSLDATDSLRRPFSGRAVQKFIKDALDKKVGYLHPDSSNENYLIFADEECYNEYIEDPIGKADLLIGIIPLSSNYYVEIDLEDTETINYINYGDTGNYIKAYFAVKNKSGASISDNFKITITIRNGSATRTINRNATYGTLFSINIDEYLLEGTNVITLSVASVTYQVGSSISLTYTALVLKVSDTLDISEVYTSENNIITAAVNIEGSGTKKIEWFVDGEQLEFDSQTDETSQSQTTLTRYINIDELSEGRHNLQYRGVISMNGVNFYSDIQYRDFIVYRGETLDSIIVNSFSYKGVDIIDSTDNPILLTDIYQYVTKEIKYAIYNPNNVATNALNITLNDKEESVNVSNFNVYTYELKSFVYGSDIELLFELNDTELAYNLTIEESDLDLSTIGNTEFEFEGTIRNNTSIDKRLENWSFIAQSGSVYHAEMDGFDYTERNGWTKDGLLIGDGASLAFDYAPLNYNISNLGGTFEFEFETRRVLDDSDVICDLRNNGIGILITASEASITSAQGVTLSSKYKSEEKNRISFVINQLNGSVNKGLVFIFVNGILSGVKNYTIGDSFTSSKTIEFEGSNNSNIVINQIRCYKRALRLDEILNNYIIYRPTVDELLSLYDSNNILVDDVLSTDKLSGQTPIIIITGNVEELQNFTPVDKGTYRKMAKIEVINTQDPSRNLTLVDASMRCQGTSSMNYPKKNFRFYTQADGKDETVQSYITKMYDAEGNEITGNDRLYSFKEGAQPAKCWCLKADYAESSSTHNTGIARLWNDVMKSAIITDVDERYFRNTTTPCRTEAQQAAIDNNYEYDVRTTVDGFPIVLFYHLNESDPLIFLGKYNWNNDKSSESVFGFKDVPGFDNTHMECWEVVNGDYPENLFTDVSDWDTDIQYDTKVIKGWQRAFESRYPDDSGSAAEATRADGALRTFATWINGLKDASKIEDGQVVVDDEDVMAQFSEEKWEHLDVYKVAAYYIYLMRFGAVDQPVKNAMFTTEDGQHWYYINYDNDTINGLDNNGALSFGYLIDRQSIDERTGSSYCYAGHDSVLWNNLEADEDFMNIVKIVDQALYDKGLKYGNVINIFNNEQSKKWSERLHNLDSQFKYLDPWLNDNNSVGLPKLQGSRDTHRQWWLSNRFALYDAINVVGSYKANTVTLRVASSDLENDCNVYVTPAITGQIYGYGRAAVPVIAGIRGTVDIPITMAVTERIYVGESLNFYNAVFTKKLDVSSLAQYLTEVQLDKVNSDAFDTSLEELILGTRISETNISALTNLTNLNNLKYLRKLSICNFNGITSIDLSTNKYFEELDATGCANLSNVIFPEAAPIKNLYFSNALQRLALKDITTIQTLSLVNNGANISTIDLRGCQLTGFTNNPSALYAWMNSRGDTIGELNVYIDNINWTNINPEEILEFGEYVKSKGYLTLKGRAVLTSCTLEQIAALREVFGQNCFDADASLRFVADGIFLIGSDDILSKGTYQYTVINATGAAGTITYSITSAASITGLSISNTGLLTVPEITGSDKTIQIRGTFVDSETGTYTNQTLDITVRKRVYPVQNVTTISGDQRVQSRHTYIWNSTTEGINTESLMYAVWTLTGDITNSVTITSQNINSCVLELTGSPISEQGTLTLVLKKIADNTIILTITKTLEALNNDIAFTSVSDPYLIEVMHSNYNANGDLLCANANYMTKVECNAVVNEDLYKHLTPGSGNSIFRNNNNFKIYCKNLDALKYFTGLTKIPDSCFYQCKIEEITIPANISEFESYCLYTDNGLTNIIFLGTSIVLNGHSCLSIHNNANINLNIDVSVNYDNYSGNIILRNNVVISIKNVVSSNGLLFDYYDLNYTHTINIENFGTSFSMLSNKPLIKVSKNATVNIDSKTSNRNLPAYFIGGESSSNVKVYLSDKITSVGSFSNNLNLYCEGNLNSIANNYFDESSKLYILNNLSVPTDLPNNNRLTGKCIIVRHDMLSAFKTAFPSISDHFTDGFTPEGDCIDFTVTGDDVPGQTIGTILHVSKLYNGYYADGTAGQEWFVTDMEQEDNFFPQNETNATVQRTIPVTINGITKSCTINQGIKNIENFIKLIIDTNGLNKNNNLFYINISILECYVNNKKVITNTNKLNNINLIENDIILIKVSETSTNYYNLNNLFRSKTYFKELDLSNFSTNVQVNVSEIARNTQVSKVTFPKNVYPNASYRESLAYGNTKLNEVICLSTKSPTQNEVYLMFASINTIGVLKYPAGTNYSAMIDVLPANWTYQEI